MSETKTEKAADPKGALVADPEIVALSKIGKLLEGLDQDARNRVVTWVWARYGYPVEVDREGD